jgi:hypothetical protein
MKYLAGISRCLSCSVAVVVAVVALAAPPIAVPRFENEQLHYSLNWPTGLSLGEATLSASSSKAEADVPERLHLQFDLDGSLPGFSIADRYHAEASPEFCSTEFTRTIAHGQKKTDDKTTFDPHNGSATRRTSGGGSSELKASSCSRDALTFLYYVRHELAGGRVPPPETVFWGAPYDIRLELAGTQTIQIVNKPVDADRYTASVKGPASSLTFDIFFLKDRTRTPALVRVPFALGTFTMELVK